jgi:hypothetical protein
MIQVFEGVRCLGFIKPEYDVRPGDFINIQCASYIVKSRQFFFTGFSNSECPFNESTPCIFVEKERYEVAT